MEDRGWKKQRRDPRSSILHPRFFYLQRHERRANLRAVHFVGHRHLSQAAQGPAHGALFFRARDEEQEPAAAGATELATVRAGFHRSQIPIIDFAGADLARQLPFQLPAFMQDSAELADIESAVAAESLQLDGVLTHSPE
jgi:hypothetical protein